MIQPIRPPHRPRRGRWIAAVALAVTLLAGILIYLGHCPSLPQASPQIVVPVAGIGTVEGVAVDRSGMLYIVDSSHDRIVRHAKTSGVQDEWHVPGDPQLKGLAVTRDGSTMYVADYIDERMFQVRTRESAPTEVPFDKSLATPVGVAVDAAGSVYYTTGYGHHIEKTNPGAGVAVELPFRGLADAEGVAVDSEGDVFVTDSGHNRVLELPAGSSQQVELPFSGLAQPWGIAVDPAHNVYVSDRRHDRVLELTHGSSTQKVLPFAGLHYPSYLAVDDTGNLYVSDWEHDRVVEMPAQDHA